MTTPAKNDPAVQGLLNSYKSDPRGHHVGKRYIPSRPAIIEIVETSLGLLYPGYFGRQDLTEDNLEAHVAVEVARLRQRLQEQVECCLCHASEVGGSGAVDVPRCRRRSVDIAEEYVFALPGIRRMLILDIQAAYDGDPAATSLDEIILAYPGLLAVTVHRLASALHRLGVPLMPRMMAEWAHTQTGADIHPGARIGESFFIDHATGVVVGETSDIGARVKLYQGVTLGALSFPRDASGRVIRGAKRHPTVDDGVTIYANATVLGGETCLGENAVIGGSVFLTKSVPQNHRVALNPPRLRVVQPHLDAAYPSLAPGEVDFEI
jgi:serine O-acetyltransferase